MTVSRRNFLAGSAAAAAAPGFARNKVPGEPTEPACLGPGPVPIKMRVNGQEVSLEVEPRTTLLEALRWQIGTSGPKEVCDRGACGACTVLLDDQPVVGCMTLAVDAVEREVTTVEGLGTPEQPNKVQEAFIQHDAVQCGYCIPGFVMSMEGELRRNPNATEEDLRHSVAGNLCRCGTYNKVFEAAARVVGNDPVPGNLEFNEAACVENHSGRVDGPAKITGAAVYCADVKKDGLLFAQHVQCPFGKAELISADVETVRRLPGVVEAEIQSGETYEYAGAPVGHLCAESPSALRDALIALRLEWKPQGTTNDPLELYQQKNGKFPPPMEELTSGRRGTAAHEALQKAAVIVEQTYQTQLQDHVPLEPHGALVDPTVNPPVAWVSTQGTFTCLEGVARGLEKKRGEVVVKCDYVGGGFGSKFGAGREGLLAARLARKYQRPVRVFNNRESEHMDAGNRPGSLQWMKIGADTNGKLLGGFIRTVGITGVSGRGGVTNPSRYDFGAVASNHVNVASPVGGSRAFRAPGHPQGMFAVDSMLEEIADKLGKDPLEVRTLNETSDVRREMYQVGADQIEWQKRQPTGSQTGRYRYGYGVGVGDWGNNPGRCSIRMQALPDGKVQVFSGTQDIGQGQRTVIADIAADALNISRQYIEVKLADSRYPFGPASGGSSTARATATAVRDCAANLIDELQTLLEVELDGDAAWLEALDKLPSDGLSAEGQVNRKYWGKGSSECVQFAKVEVDTATGNVNVQKVIALHACGQVANRLTAENQIIGGVIQGISYALFEEKTMDPYWGVQLNADHEHYKIAGALDVHDIVPLLWPQKDGGGVRSLGEPPSIPTAGAIANAIANATGVRVRSLPITPQRLLQAMEEQA